MKRLSAHRRALIAGVVGNIMEWYDFAIYAFFASTIGRAFFPAGDESVSLLVALATFGVGFVTRPIGAIVLGSYADRAGRKKALMATMLLMAVGTAMIGLAPTYDSIGWWAPFLIVTARLIQGFSTGGELGSATAFMMEHSPDERRGLAASWQQSSQAAALLAGTLAGVAVTSVLSAQAVQSWGWRLPFLLGLLIVPAGLFIRTHIDETPAFAKLEVSERRQPLHALLRGHGRQVVAGLGLVIIWTVCMYFFMVYMPIYAVRQLGLSQSGSLTANCIALGALVVLAPIFGKLSDSIGRKPLLLFGAGGICVLSYPLLALLSARPSLPFLIAVQLAIAVLIAVFTGPAPAALGELYPTSVRSSGMSLAYNGAVTIFGGFAPFISTWLVARTESSLAPAYYVVASAVLSLIALAFMRETCPAVAAAQRAGVSP